MPECPLPSDVLPKPLQKHADPKAPPPLRMMGAKGAALELLLLNPATSDVTIARLAPVLSQKLVEIVRQNELRLLRHDEILRGLCQNPNALASTLDGACDFCVRNGLTLLDVPRSVEAHRWVHGVVPTAVAPAETATA